jgi:hypothetical protein
MMNDVLSAIPDFQHVCPYNGESRLTILFWQYGRLVIAGKFVNRSMQNFSFLLLSGALQFRGLAVGRQQYLSRLYGIYTFWFHSQGFGQTWYLSATLMWIPALKGGSAVINCCVLLTE